MKNFSKFGFSVVNAGQRNVVVEPQLVVTTTAGGFRSSSALSKALGLTHGGYAAFVNNIGQMDEAIRTKHPDIVAFANEKGLDLSTFEGREAVHAEFDMWALIKGYVLRNPKTGEPLKAAERLTKEDKKKIAADSFDEMYASAMVSDNEELKAALNAAESREQQIDILAESVSIEVDKYQGSKCANPASLSGSDVTLNFTDSATYKKLRGNCPEGYNRIYSIDLNNMITIPINDGKNDFDVQAVVLGDYVDVESTRANKE